MKEKESESRDTGTGLRRDWGRIRNTRKDFHSQVSRSEATLAEQVIQVSEVPVH